MSVFTWTPDFKAGKNSKPTVSQIKFGDGYEARVAHGINTDPKIWTVKFSAREVSEIDAIEAFLEARGGTEAFDWTPPRAGSASKFVCREWDRSIDSASFDTLTAKFEEVFEP